MLQPPPSTPSSLATAVMTRCQQLAACSEHPGAITRRFLTPAMRDAHQLVAGWMHESALQTRVDNAGNLVGRRAGGGADRVLLIGSHLDTVPAGGAYDGVLGVLMGLAVAEHFRDRPLPFHLDVIGFSEEEGVRFSKPYLGSSAAAGSFRPEWLDRPDADGRTMRDAIADFGLAPDQIADCCYDADQVVGYLEPHLEQGPVLEGSGRPVGVVSAIAGQSRLRLALHGEAAHVGTTPVPERKDALVVAAQVVGHARQLAQSTPGLRATVGRMEVRPNAPNVVPGRVELSLDVRHFDDAVRLEAVERLIAGAHVAAQAEGVRAELIENAGQGATAVDPGLTDLLSGAAAAAGADGEPLMSGAGHDAVIMATRFPTAMLFLRHPGAISHHPDERVEADDVAVGVDVLIRFVELLAERERSRT